jgi:hypothetical protein
MLKPAVFSLALVLLVSVALASPAAEVVVETVLTGLTQPRGVAVRPGGTPESYEVFVADTGARRVLKMASNVPHQSSEVVTGFPAAAEGGKLARFGNPSCLLFLDRERLVVGLVNVPPEVRLYELADAADGPLAAEKADQRVTARLPEGELRSVQTGCGAIARSRANDAVSDMLFVTVGSGVEPLWKLPIRAGTLDTMTPFATERSAAVSVPTALTVSEQAYIVLAEASGRSAKMSLQFLNPTNGQAVMNVPTKLTDMIAMSYSAKTRNLYVAGRESGTGTGGVFRVDESSIYGAAEAVKVAVVARPTAMAFAPDGALYVTALGEPHSNGTDAGVLLKLTGEL